MKGAQGRNRTTDTRIFSPLVEVPSLNSGPAPAPDGAPTFGPHMHFSYFWRNHYPED